MEINDIKLLANAGYITDVTLFSDEEKLKDLLNGDMKSFISKYVTQMGLDEEKLNVILEKMKSDGGENTEEAPVEDKNDEEPTGDKNDEAPVEDKNDEEPTGDKNDETIAPMSISEDEELVATTTTTKTKSTKSTTKTITSVE